MWKFCLTLLLTFISLSACAGDIYVSPMGNDTANGTTQAFALYEVVEEEPTTE